MEYDVIGSRGTALRRERILRAANFVTLIAFLLLIVLPAAHAEERPRARDLGVPFEGTPGPLNAITDVAGVEVGHTTLISGSGKRVVGKGPVRTGVTAVWPRGKASPAPVFAAWFSLNGDGEMTGTTWIQDSGLMEGPVMITNTLSVGIVHHAVVGWGVKKSLDYDGPGYPPFLASLPVVAETWDGSLNDIMGQHVSEEDALAAMADAASGPVKEGNVGGGTGMICHSFKGGIGTSSRAVQIEEKSYMLGVLVQCNYGWRGQLRIAGVPVGKEIPDLMPSRKGSDASAGRPSIPWPAQALESDEDVGSIIVVVATDAPILPHQLKRVARRISLGLARNGSTSGNGSGDIFVGFSTANREAAQNRSGQTGLAMIANEELSPLFTATVQATEEAIINAMVAAEDMTGANGITVYALPHDRLREALRKYNRLQEPAS
jgi:L-aminopeptidase/D-esterase-like protein